MSNAMSTTEVSNTSLFQVDRQHQIYLLALKHGSVDVSELAQRFDVTTETIRRDLSDLQENQLVRRVHGGAVLVERRTHEPMLEARGVQNAAEKLAIAQLAIAEAPVGGTIIIDSGTTGLRFAEVMPVDGGAHVTTNSLVTGLTLARRGLSDLFVLGGTVTTNTFAMLDVPAVEAVRNMNVDVLFISCDGLSFKRGLTTPYRDEHHMKQAMIQSARRVIALVDQSKFGNDQTFCFAPFKDIDVLITDSRASDDEVQILTEAGVEVRRATA
jgi:DeoR family transcriptional regulator, fructose operon transcriptional repressor